MLLVPRDGAGELRGRGDGEGDERADFVCVKLDREERPDVDDIYMNATADHERAAADGR
jgi:hypothetical protein